MIYGKFVQTIPNNNKTFQSVFDETTFTNVFAIMDESHLFADESYVSIQEKYDMLLEGVIGDIFNAITNAIKKFFEWIKNFFSKLFKKQSETSEKIKDATEKAEEKEESGDSSIDKSVKRMRDFLDKNEKDDFFVIMDNNWASIILNENPDLGTDFITKLFSIISDGYKKNVKDVFGDINSEIEKVKARIYTPEFYKDIEGNTDNFAGQQSAIKEICISYLKQKGHVIEFKKADSDSDIEAKINQFRKESKVNRKPSFDFFGVEKKIDKFASDVNKIVNSLKKDFNKFTKEVHPDNSRDDSDEVKTKKQNYMVCLNCIKNFFDKVAFEFRLMYSTAYDINLSNGVNYLSLSMI